jgi:hypothetical protein
MKEYTITCNGDALGRLILTTHLDVVMERDTSAKVVG